MSEEFIVEPLLSLVTDTLSVNLFVTDEGVRDEQEIIPQQAVGHPPNKGCSSLCFISISLKIPPKAGKMLMPLASAIPIAEASETD
jgi:hypothetical protein